jgi:hypothetical protein
LVVVVGAVVGRVDVERVAGGGGGLGAALRRMLVISRVAVSGA